MKNKIVLVRTKSAGVHFGTLVSDPGIEITLEKSQRIWYWSGAATLSQLAMDGIGNPANSKITMSVNSIFLTGVIEIIPMSKKSIINFSKIKPWTI